MDSLGAGGAERSTADLWYFLRNEGVQVHIILLGHTTPGLEKEIMAADFNVYFLDGLSFIQQSKAIVEKVKELNPGVVHSILFKANIRTRLARLQYRFTHVESLVNCTYDPIRLKDPNVGKAAFRFYKLLDRHTSFLVDHYHSITNTVKDHYVTELGVSPSKVTVIYRGRNGIKKSPIERYKLGFSDDDFLIINTGRHDFQKGQIFLVRTVHLLKQRGYDNIKLLILGREGSATKSIKQYIAENILSRDIVLGGYRSNVAEILTLGDLFAFPSLYEGLGGALIEAQAAGLPIICNSLSVFDEVVIEGQNALKFQSEDIESIAHAVLFFYENREARLNFGKKSRENFESKFKLGKVNNDMFLLYKNLSNV